MKKDKVGLIIILGVASFVGLWIGIIGFFTLSNIPPGYEAPIWLGFFPMVFIGVALASIVWVIKDKKNLEVG